MLRSGSRMEERKSNYNHQRGFRGFVDSEVGIEERFLTVLLRHNSYTTALKNWNELSRCILSQGLWRAVPRLNFLIHNGRPKFECDSTLSKPQFPHL